MAQGNRISRRQFARALTQAAGILALPSISIGSPLRDQPALMLANVYTQDVDVQSYWVSEKYDGVRAYWNGRSLVTRTGNAVAIPNWFAKDYPRDALDGELWIDRGRFEELLAAVRDKHPDHEAWREVKFMVFDLPGHSGTSTERLAALRALVTLPDSSSLQLVPHWRVPDHASLEQELERIVAEGGEGLMLKRGEAHYHAQRSNDLLKLKPYHDAEARVIGHIPGRGKHKGALGALEVQRSDGVIFRIGTGFTDAQRRAPPPIGSWVTYRYHGSTMKGIPRFASFLRVRD